MRPWCRPSLRRSNRLRARRAAGCCSRRATSSVRSMCNPAREASGSNRSFTRPRPMWPRRCTRSWPTCGRPPRGRLTSACVHTRTGLGRFWRRPALRAGANRPFWCGASSSRSVSGVHRAHPPSNTVPREPRPSAATAKAPTLIRRELPSMTQRKITDDLNAMLEVLPSTISESLHRMDRWDELLEVILDLGRVPTARYLDGETVLDEHEVTRELIDFVVSRIGEFDADNRAGMERTLHRISAIRNRRGHIVGLTCRVGRAVYGTIDIIEDLVASGKSLLLLGRPGIGKTTMLREAARILAEAKRVVIVDTSNEIGGDGDVPHPAVGRARGMQGRQPP